MKLLVALLFLVQILYAAVLYSSYSENTALCVAGTITTLSFSDESGVVANVTGSYQRCVDPTNSRSYSQGSDQEYTFSNGTYKIIGSTCYFANVTYQARTNTQNRIIKVAGGPLFSLIDTYHGAPYDLCGKRTDVTIFVNTNANAAVKTYISRPMSTLRLANGSCPTEVGDELISVVDSPNIGYVDGAIFQLPAICFGTVQDYCQQTCY
jgi:hypothetical protein